MRFNNIHCTAARRKAAVFLCAAVCILLYLTSVFSTLRNCNAKDITCLRFFRKFCIQYLFCVRTACYSFSLHRIQRTHGNCTISTIWFHQFYLIAHTIYFSVQTAQIPARQQNRLSLSKPPHSHRYCCHKSVYFRLAFRNKTLL